MGAIAWLAMPFKREPVSKFSMRHKTKEDKGTVFCLQISDTYPFEGKEEAA